MAMTGVKYFRKIEYYIKICRRELLGKLGIVTGVEHSKELFTEMKKNENFIYTTTYIYSEKCKLIFQS